MAAANTDKFKKVARKWVGQVGAGGVADAVVTTVPLASATSLPTDTAVEVVIDRVDSSGTKTPTLEETIVGVVSGDNLTSCVRGVEGTAQAHSAGAVVEVVLTADNWNDLIDGVIAEHAQDGTHGAVTATSVNIGSTIAVTGTLDEDDMASDSAVKVATQQSIKAYVDSGTVTMTNKRITKRETTEASSATPTINTDNTDIHTITALATNITSFTTNLSGTPTDGQTLIIRIQDSGSGQTIAWGASFESAGATLPTSITAGKKAYVGFLYNADDSKWDCVAAIEEA